MNKHIRFSSAILLTPFLMGASLVPTNYSQMLEYQIKGTVLQSGSQETSVTSTRDQKMGTAKLNYELIYNDNAPYQNIHRNEWRYYTINYRLDLYPENKVKYANGLGGWFTETGNAAVKAATVEVTYQNGTNLVDSTSFNNISFIGGDEGAKYNLCLPKDNNSSFFGNTIDGACYFYQTDEAVRYYSSNVSDVDAEVKLIESTAPIHPSQQSVVKAKTSVEFPNRPRKKDNKPYVSFYGCYRFASANETEHISISYSGTFVIAEGGTWGSCEKTTKLSEVGFSWQRPALFF